MCGHRNLTSKRERARFQFMQALADAIEFRRARAAESCPDCGPGKRRCDDHACDLMLIEDYRRSLAAVTSGTDPGVVATGG